MWQRFGNKLVLFFIFLAFAVGMITYGLARPVSSANAPVLITVEPGMTTNDIGMLLKQRGLILNELLFRVLAKIEGLDGSLQAGEYQITPSMTVRQIIDMLARGETAYRQFTIPEGFTVDQVAALLEQHKISDASQFKSLARAYVPYDYMTAGEGTLYTVEGFLFPDTYRVASGATAEDILKMLTKQFDRQFTPAMRARAAELNLSIREVIILASLVEKEAQLERERPIIASVFFNRLKQGMPLQSCATIQYILGYPKPELTVQDTQIVSPYNTYQHSGLPPGPIANPGLASIQAVLYPAETDYLYFVADKSGAHRFSRTYDEHLAAIEQVGKN
ncbi:aminodeoxychorismate lyase [Thermosinus carboxydivorans Nor1]|uniref:Endolytic murein transglycosylase n=1 Tax=Thermosinus carboxydivorans Nor1 TaxID=401526 RepID=A1HUA2_9FIRM|nr:endolytic transglycosylase MltG [Thermosinus carboxydivorans]EAX46410.1 aminodeoxychorismate lyase [Thermosinus carboxydivorans Nor1]